MYSWTDVLAVKRCQLIGKIEEQGVVSSVQVKLYVVSARQVGDIFDVRSKAERAENGTLGNAAVDLEAGRLAARVSIDLSPIG